MTDGVEIVAGTYEEFLVGYKVKNVEGSVELSQSFANHAHTGSVKSVVASGRYLLSGGADDKVVVHDMKTRSENTVLMHHDGTVNSIAITSDDSHAITAGADGSLYVVRVGSWQVEKHWPKAHKGSAVTYVSIHPSNKLALTLGNDHTLRTWNLIKGRLAYATNLKSKGTADPLSVTWSPEGLQFAMTGYSDVSVWSVTNATVKKVLKCPSKSVCLAWISESSVAIGLESGEIIIFKLDSDESFTFKGHAQRIKGIAYSEKYLYTGSSAGDIKVWKLKPNKMKLLEKASVNTDCRITCLALVHPDRLVKKEKIEPAIESDAEETADATENGANKKKRKRETQAEEETEEIDLPKIKQPSIEPYVSVTVEKDNAKPKAKKHFSKKGKKKLKKT